MNPTRAVHFKYIFVSALATLAAVILIVYLTGLKQHRTLYANSVMIIGITAAGTFLFTCLGLYKGWRLIGWSNPLERYIAAARKKGLPDFPAADPGGMLDEDGTGSCLVSALVFLLFTGIGLVLVWVAGLFFIGLFVALWSMLYWLVWSMLSIFFRHSPRCRGNMYKSVATALFYTVVYFGWLFAMIYLGNRQGI